MAIEVKKRKFELTLSKKILIVGIIITLFFVIVFGYNQYQYKNYVSTEAKITSIDSSYGRKGNMENHWANCEYNVNDEIVSSRFMISNRIDYKEGETVTVYYNPKDPVVLKDKTTSKTLLQCSFISALITAVLYVISFKKRNKK